MDIPLHMLSVHLSQKLNLAKEKHSDLNSLSALNCSDVVIPQSDMRNFCPLSHILKHQVQVLVTDRMGLSFLS